MRIIDGDQPSILFKRQQVFQHVFALDDPPHDPWWAMFIIEGGNQTYRNEALQVLGSAGVSALTDGDGDPDDFKIVFVDMDAALLFKMKWT